MPQTTDSPIKGTDTEMRFSTFKVHDFNGRFADLTFTRPASQRQVSEFLAQKYRSIEPLFSTLAPIEDEPNLHLGSLPSPVHHWFELSYANYLTVPRSVLQAMPTEWQERFTQCLEEMDAAIDWRPRDHNCYKVELCPIEEMLIDGEWEEGFGEAIDDPLSNYRYPTGIELRREYLGELDG